MIGFYALSSKLISLTKELASHGHYSLIGTRYHLEGALDCLRRIRAVIEPAIAELEQVVSKYDSKQPQRG